MLVARVYDLHKVLEVMHEEVPVNNQKKRTKSQQTHNTKTNVISSSFQIGDYIMMHPINAPHGKLNTGWIAPMRIADTMSDLVFVVENLYEARIFVVHAHRLTSYPVHSSGAGIHKKSLEHA